MFDGFSSNTEFSKEFRSQELRGLRSGLCAGHGKELRRLKTLPQIWTLRIPNWQGCNFTVLYHAETSNFTELQLILKSKLQKLFWRISRYHSPSTVVFAWNQTSGSTLPSKTPRLLFIPYFFKESLLNFSREFVLPHSHTIDVFWSLANIMLFLDTDFDRLLLICSSKLAPWRPKLIWYVQISSITDTEKNILTPIHFLISVIRMP